MATVYRAHDPLLDRDVALKVMLPGFGGRADLAARFQREARALAATRDDAIVAAYEFLAAGDDRPACLVGELIQGPSLRAVLDAQGGKVWPEIALLVGLRVAQALAVAHAAGIVHRDVKPDNVLVDLRAGPCARVVLGDFGVARILGSDSNTTTGALLGSPAYMSPEQARGADEVGPPSDVFSLGVLLYQLVTGVLPFAGKEPVVVIANILRGEVVRPGRLCARLSPAFEKVILRCLSPAARDRYPDGAAVRAALADLRAPLPFENDQRVLGDYLEDPEAFAHAHAGALARLAVADAETARQKRDRAGMLAHLNRALEYDPHEPRATRLLAELSAHGGRRASLIAAAAAALVAALGLGAWRVSARRPKALAPPVTFAGTATAAPRAAVPSSAPASPAPTIAASTIPAPALPAPMAAAAAVASSLAVDPRVVEPTGRANSSSRKRLTQRAVSGVPVSAPVAAHPPASTATGEGTPAPVPSPLPVRAAASTGGDTTQIRPPEAPETPAAEARVENAAPAAVAATEPPSNPLHAPEVASLTVRAAHAFCAPSVDDRPPGLHPSYRDLSPGTHAVYCTLPGKSRELVARYPLRAGTHPNLIIVPDSAGRPVLGRPE
jgi:serine/threonine-protein kinase